MGSLFGHITHQSCSFLSSQLYILMFVYCFLSQIDSRASLPVTDSSCNVVHVKLIGIVRFRTSYYWFKSTNIFIKNSVFTFSRNERCNKNQKNKTPCNLDSYMRTSLKKRKGNKTVLWRNRSWLSYFRKNALHSCLCSQIKNLEVRKWIKIRTTRDDENRRYLPAKDFFNFILIRDWQNHLELDQRQKI